MAATSKRGRKPERRSGVQSIDVGSQLLQALTRHHGPMQLREIASAAGMTSSKAHRYLTSLVRVGLAQQDSDSARYDLGPLALAMGLAALNRRDAVQYATKAIIELNQAEDLTTGLSVWGQRGPTIIGWYDSSRRIVCNLDVGAVLQLLGSASGRVFLAYLPREVTRSMVESELALAAESLPRSSVKSKADVEDLIRRVRASRLGMTHEDLVPGQSAVAAPIFDHQGCIAAVIFVVGLSAAIHSKGPRSPSSIVRGVADTVSLRLGFDAGRRGRSFVEQLETSS